MFLSSYLIQQDGTAGTFRPADDIFEDASRKLQPIPQTTDADSSALSENILRFSSLQVAKESLKQICDVRGTSPPSTADA